jgi:hypothetical protein
MVDFIKIVAYKECIFTPSSYEPFEWKELMFYPKFKNGCLTGFESSYEGFRVFLHYDRIEIANSIHKFYKGNNHSDFTYSELREAINIICHRFDIDAKEWKIIKMEFGFVILTPEPAKQYIDFFFEYKSRVFEKMKHKHNYYGRKCFMSEYALKVYDKSFQSDTTISDNILRVEYCYNQKRKLPKQINTLSDLLHKNKFKELYRDFDEAFSKVIYKDEVDFTKSTTEERMLFFASLDPSFIKVEESINKDGAKRIKQKIKQLKERFYKRTFKKWFLKSLSNKYIELYCS